MSKIQAELTEVTGVKPKAKEGRQKFLYRLSKTLSSDDFPEASWAKLSDEAQEWSNQANKAADNGLALPDFPDIETKGKKPAKESEAVKGDMDSKEQEEDDMATSKKKAAKKAPAKGKAKAATTAKKASGSGRSEEHTSELQSQSNLVCRLLL